MNNIVHWNPLGELDRNFASMVGALRDKPAADKEWKPSVDIREMDDSYCLDVELPAVDPKDVRVELHKGVLNISGERRFAGDDNRVHLRERRFGKFWRGFHLPEDADANAIRATAKDGIVSITVGKNAEGQARADRGGSGLTAPAASGTRRVRRKLRLVPCMMRRMAAKPLDIHLLTALHEGDHRRRCETLRQLCPCRNNHVRDLAVWREVFHKALHGGMRERDQAAHAIGTLTEKAQRSAEWRNLLHSLRDELDALMLDTRASRRILGQMKKHGHAHRGAARQNYRRRRRSLDLATPAELAAWVNGAFNLAREQRVSATDPGVLRLAHWLKHRIACQPARRTKEGELIDKAKRYLPHLLGEFPLTQVVG